MLSHYGHAFIEMALDSENTGNCCQQIENRSDKYFKYLPSRCEIFPLIENIVLGENSRIELRDKLIKIRNNKLI